MQEQIPDPGLAAPGLDVRAGEAVAVAGLFRFLGRCLEEEIDRDLLRALRGAIGQSLLEMGWTMDRAFLEGPEDELLEQLAEEFTGLFVAPGGVSPYASVFETGCMYREPCDQVMAAYSEAGWDYRRKLTGEFPDHIGTMLCFLGELAAKESQALEQGDAGSADAWAERRRTFLLDQLGPWAPGWCRRASKAALLPFYRQVLQFTEQLLWQQLSEVADRRRLKELVALNQREPKKLDYDADFRKASGI
ncbi:MAG: molecular chaperone TorD family protein [Pseudomonadota bacterium]|nr:molecular chaperone TorD family protein [Pseudomonadota bacterium]